MTRPQGAGPVHLVRQRVRGPRSVLAGGGASTFPSLSEPPHSGQVLGRGGSPPSGRARPAPAARPEARFLRWPPRLPMPRAPPPPGTASARMPSGTPFGVFPHSVRLYVREGQVGVCTAPYASPPQEITREPQSGLASQPSVWPLTRRSQDLAPRACSGLPGGLSLLLASRSPAFASRTTPVPSDSGQGFP